MGILNSSGQEVSGPYLQVARWNQYAQEYGREYGVSPSLILGDIEEESGGNPYATSRAGAEGLMQLEPGTASSLGVTNPYSAKQNIKGGTEYLAEMYKRFGNWTDALGAYNAGPGNYSAGVKNGYAGNVLSNAKSFGNVAGNILPPSGSSSGSGGYSFSYPKGGTNWQDFLIQLNEMETLSNFSWNIDNDLGHIVEWSAVKIGLILFSLILVIGGFILFQPKMLGGMAEL